MFARIADAVDNFRSTIQYERPYVRQAARLAVLYLDDGFTAKEAVDKAREFHFPIGIIGNLTVRKYLHEQVDNGTLTVERTSALPLIGKKVYR